jgi:hypothetical protein
LRPEDLVEITDERRCRFWAGLPTSKQLGEELANIAGQVVVEQLGT